MSTRLATPSPLLSAGIQSGTVSKVASNYSRKTARKTQPAAGLVARDLERRRVAQELRDDVQEAKRQLGV